MEPGLYGLLILLYNVELVLDLAQSFHASQGLLPGIWTQSLSILENFYTSLHMCLPFFVSNVVVVSFLRGWLLGAPVEELL